MSATAPVDPRLDRLYSLLPAIYRLRDAEQGYPLQALLRVISEQVNVVEDDIAQLYENWFIETAESWVVPYLGDLIGYRPLSTLGADAMGTTEVTAPGRVLAPRREVGHTVRYRRRKGTLPILEQLCADITGWPSRAVELFKLLGWTQNLNHRHLERGRTVDVRLRRVLERVGGPFDGVAHTVDVRRVDSRRRVGLYDIPSIAVFAWRLKAYPVTYGSAYCVEGEGQHCYSFSILGHDQPLFHRPVAAKLTGLTGEVDVPAPITRLQLEAQPAPVGQALGRCDPRYYGADLSLAIWADGWAGFSADVPIPAECIIPADLSGWTYEPPPKHIAVDPELGRFAFPPGQTPKRGVRVRYHYGQSDDLGGGEYPRTLLEPAPRPGGGPGPATYLVGRACALRHISDAVSQWEKEKPLDAIIEVTDGGVYTEPITIELGAKQSLQLRAANGCRPVIRILDRQADMPDALLVMMAAESRFTLDGMMITGRALEVRGPDPGETEDATAEVCGANLTIRHCTLVPGWGIGRDCAPHHPGEPSLELEHLRARVQIERSILGPIRVHEDEVATDPIPLVVVDSIVDAMDQEGRAITATDMGPAFVLLTVVRSTVMGIVDVHAIQRADNAIFASCVDVARRQLGCIRFCYVPSGCRTPRRYECQPDGVEQAAQAGTGLDPDAVAAEVSLQRLRVRPQFTSQRYGMPGYFQLALTCADEIRRGAEDESEMGVFHDLFQPQREDGLRNRLAEFTPAGMDVGLLFVT